VHEQQGFEIAERKLPRQSSTSVRVEPESLEIGVSIVRWGRHQQGKREHRRAMSAGRSRVLRGEGGGGNSVHILEADRFLKFKPPARRHGMGRAGSPTRSRENRMHLLSQPAKALRGNLG